MVQLTTLHQVIVPIQFGLTPQSSKGLQQDIIIVNKLHVHSESK